MTKLKNLTDEEKEELNKLGRDIVLSAQETVRAVTKNIDISQMTYQAQNIVKSLEPALQSLNKLHEAVKAITVPAIPFVQEFTEHAVRISRNIQIWREKSEKIAEQLEKDDVFLIPFFADINKVHMLVDEIEDKTMLNFYDGYFKQEKGVTEILDSWMNNPFFLERKGILEKCLQAHQRGDYELSIPVFYIQIEAVCKWLVKMDGKTEYLKLKKKLKNKYRDEDDDKEGILKFISEEYAVEFITDQIFQKDDVYSELSAYPNRHGILHGSDINYYKKSYASLRCLLLLDVLSELERER